MKKLLIACALGALLSSPLAMAASQADAARAITEAVVKNNAARKAGFEWRDTYKKLLGPAKQAYRKGDYDRAVKLANTARAHAELGLAQARQAARADLHD